MALLRRLIGLVGPGGVGVFQWPYRTADSGLVGASRWLRERVPGRQHRWRTALRGKPAADPFIPTHAYDLERDAPGVRPARSFDRRTWRWSITSAWTTPSSSRTERETASARVARRRLGQRRRGPRRAAPTRFRMPSIDAFNQAADAYFTSLAGWEHHLAKPFSQIEETPTLLMGVAVLLQALRADAGHDRAGVRRRFRLAVALPHADGLPRRAARRVARRPCASRANSTRGNRSWAASPRRSSWSSTGGASIFPTRASTAIVCFDAFHHAPNPRAVIREFARVLVDGGIAGFAEPGPRHAEAPRSQFESQTYGVVERDVDVHDVWRTAQACGFRDLRMCVFHGPPHHVSLRRVRGPGGRRTGRRTRGSRRRASSCGTCGASASSRTGAERADSRDAGRPRLRHSRVARRPPPSPGQPIVIDAIVTNTGAATWLRLECAARRRRARDAPLRRSVRRARDVRLPRRAADRSAARDPARRDRAPSASRCRRSRQAATASNSIASRPTSPGSRKSARVRRRCSRRRAGA